MLLTGQAQNIQHTCPIEEQPTTQSKYLVFLRLERAKIWLVEFDSRRYGEKYSHRLPKSTKCSQQSYTGTLTTLVLAIAAMVP